MPACLAVRSPMLGLHFRYSTVMRRDLSTSFSTIDRFFDYVIKLTRLLLVTAKPRDYGKPDVAAEYGALAFVGPLEPLYGRLLASV